MGEIMAIMEDRRGGASRNQALLDKAHRQNSDAAIDHDLGHGMAEIPQSSTTNERTIPWMS
jgi:hypothetical protein